MAPPDRLIMLGLAILLAAIFFVAALVRSALGFGDALVAMPLLTLAIGLNSAAPLFAAVAFLSSVAILWGSWGEVHWRDALPLVLGSAAGIPFGLILLSRAPEAAMKAALGVVIIVFVLARHFVPGLRIKRGGTKRAVLAGLVAGVLGGAYNINGPPVAIFGTLRGWSPQRFRATMQGFFLPSGALLVTGHAVAGLWTQRLAILAVLCLPAMLVGVRLGAFLNRSIEPERFEHWIRALLILIGALLIIQTLVERA